MAHVFRWSGRERQWDSKLSRRSVSNLDQDGIVAFLKFWENTLTSTAGKRSDRIAGSLKKAWPFRKLTPGLERQAWQAHLPEDSSSRADVG